MGKYENKRKKQHFGWIAVIAALLALALAAVLLLPRLEQPAATSPTTEPSHTESDSGTTQTEVTETEAAVQDTVAAETEVAEHTAVGAAVEFPLMLAGGNIEVESLFRFDGINPDCDNREGRNIAALVLKNVSDTHLAEAKITMTLSDGTQLNFVATHLPAGKTAMVFSTENQSLSADAVCTEVACDVRWDEATDASGQISVSVEGTRITLTNNSGEDISELVIYCRTPLGEEYFGGVTYQYTVNELSADESATVDAVDCILGMVEVVRIVVGNE